MILSTRPLFSLLLSSLPLFSLLLSPSLPASRKNTLLLNNVVIWLGVGLESLAVNPIMFIVGRFVVGINSGTSAIHSSCFHSVMLSFCHLPIPIHTYTHAGINTVLVPLYISEIAPIKLRGAIGVLHQMAITTTILLSQVLGLEKVHCTMSYIWLVMRVESKARARQCLNNSCLGWDPNPQPPGFWGSAN